MNTGKLLKDPFVHFCLLGTLIFFAVKEDSPYEVERRVVIDEALFDSLNQSFEEMYRRQPSAAEIEEWVGRYIDEEILFREALSLGLHEVDHVVRRQMVQSMRVLLEEPAPSEPLPDGELEEYISEHSERYQVPGRYSFEHVFLEGEGESLQDEAGQILLQLRAGEVSSPAGDAFLHGVRFIQWAQERVEGVFGASFMERLEGLPSGEWQGPLESSYGLHLVRVFDRVLPRQATLEEVRELVSLDLRADRRVEQIQEAISRLRESYVIDMVYQQPGD